VQSFFAESVSAVIGFGDGFFVVVSVSWSLWVIIPGSVD